MLPPELQKAVFDYLQQDAEAVVERRMMGLVDEEHYVSPKCVNELFLPHYFRRLLPILEILKSLANDEEVSILCGVYEASSALRRAKRAF